ncbi:MAG: flavodoxin domain-containing protein [bacterium]|nr:flavodoxin domain-containing protein [bacterium]
MKSLIIYSSQTGFTKRYAEWLNEHLKGDLLTVKEAQKKDDGYFNQYDCLVYGGFSLAGKINKADWFTAKMNQWKGKKLALFCVGASCVDQPEVAQAMDAALTDEQKKYAKAFYCPGGINYSKLPLPSRLVLKGLSSMLKKKADATPSERDMAEKLTTTFDISDPAYILPIVEYLTQES